MQEVQQRQMELLDKFSHHVRVTKIDQKYKEQYLDTIKQLVQEQVKINTTSTSHNVVIILSFYSSNIAMSGSHPDLHVAAGE